MKEIAQFRPSARLIRTIGDRIIKDPYAAVVELVKNAYDADASYVEIKFHDMKSQKKAKIIIKDDGHGMTSSDVTTKWMIPATRSKVDTRKSPKGRIMQGRKGIGRFAAAILGEYLTLQTIDKSGDQTKVEIDWNIFEDKKFLDEISLDIETEKTEKKSGTELIITPYKDNWDVHEYSELLKELKKLIFPFKKKKDFKIIVEFVNVGVEEFDDSRSEIEPYPIIDMFDYRLHGTIDAKGKATLVFQNQAEKSIPSENISLDLKPKSGKYCGNIKFDFRVFDRDPDAIENLIKRGLHKPGSDEPLGKREARQLLNEHCGVSIYREDFRIRPYGEVGYDWLGLDKLRVQNPSLKIGADQIIGLVNINPEEKSGLEEKSARDGLKENPSYEGLKEMLAKCLQELESRRFTFRKKTGRGRRGVKIEKQLDSLFNFTNLRSKVDNELKKSKVSNVVITKIEDVISKTEKSKAKTLKNIKETIAMYQGQVTVGKIVIVIMHEGRKPLKYLKEQSPRIIEWIDELKSAYSEGLGEKIISRLEHTKSESELLIELFNRLDPLAVKKRGKKKDVKVKKVIEHASELFASELKKNKISLTIQPFDDVHFTGWEQDLYIALTNLIDNSIYWLSQEEKDGKIDIFAEKDEDNVLIHYRDNGPGIEKKNIENDMIFEPGFSTKPEGTGLGLSISGEAIERNDGKLKAIYSKEGAYFRIELPEEEKK